MSGKSLEESTVGRGGRGVWRLLWTRRSGLSEEAPPPELSPQNGMGTAMHLGESIPELGWSRRWEWTDLLYQPPPAAEYFPGANVTDWTLVSSRRPPRLGVGCQDVTWALPARGPGSQLRPPAFCLARAKRRRTVVEPGGTHARCESLNHCEPQFPYVLTGGGVTTAQVCCAHQQ